MVELTKISTHTKTRQGVTYKNTKSTNRTIKGNGMYTFVYGTGSKRKSETKHCSEAQAQAYKKQLEAAGY